MFFQGNTAAMIAIEMGNDKLANYLNGTYVEPVLTLALMMDLWEDSLELIELPSINKVNLV